MTRLAIIGAGLMGEDHARIISRELPRAELHVVCDMDAARAKRVADTFGAKDVASDPEATIARSDVDAVVVASPDFTHAPLSRACIAAGRPFVMLGFMRRCDADCHGRYHEAYVRQNRAFPKFAETGRFPDIASSCWDGYCAAIVAEAGVRALASGGKEPITLMTKPDFYAGQCEVAA